jgi:magnesium-transporting ATPase (P-type)
LKRKVIVRQVPGESENVRVYVKGAPEYVFDKCTESLDDHFQKVEFAGNAKDAILENSISHDMAAQGYKVISYAFKDMPLTKMNELFHSCS